jgi:WD40 repeat protein
MWNPQTGGITLQQRRYSSIGSDKLANHVWCSLMLDEHRCLFGCSDGQIELYPNPTGSKNILVHHSELGGITHLLRASSTTIVSATRRGYLMAFAHTNGSIKEMYAKRIHQWPIRVCQVDFNSSLIFTGSDDHSIKVTNVANGLSLHTLHKHQAPVNCLALDTVIFELLVTSSTWY